MSHPDPKDLILVEGQEIRFPVEPTDPLARFQSLRTVESLDDVADFEFVKQWRRLASAAVEGASNYLEPVSESQGYAPGFYPSEAMVLEAVRGRGQLLELKLADFIVPVGAKTTLVNPWNVILAKRVVISGTLEVHGDIVLYADELGG